MTGFLTTRGGAPLTVAAALMALSLGAVRASAQTAGEWDVTVPRGETREIDFVTDEGTWTSVDISPDGEWIVFDLLGHVYRMPARGGDAESLTQSSGIAVNYHPRISPDGSMIAFVSDRAGQENLWVMDADGTNPRPILLDDESRAAEPVWTPDGNHILMTRRQQTSVGFYRTSDELWRLPVDGGQGELLVRLDGEAGSAPARVGFWDGIDRAQWASVSDLGDYVYFNAAKFAGTDRHIRRIQLETGRIETVTEAKGRYAACCGRPAYPSHLGEAAPEISPDGRWLAFVRKLPGGKTSWRGRQYQGRTALWVRDMETGAERILMDPVPNSLLEHHPAWATRAQPGYSWDREGRSIVLSQGGKIRRLWVESGQVETIPFQARVHRVIGEMPRGRFTIRDDTLEPRHVRWPVLSGDGRLVFETAGQLWIQEQAGAGPRPLVRQPGVGLPHTPTWSPDGQWVAYTTWSDTAGGRLWKVRPGGDPVELAGGPDTYLGPRWSADGASVTVGWRPAALDDMRWRTVSVPAAGGDAALAAPDATPLAPRGAERPAVSPDGSRIAFEYQFDLYVAPYSEAATREDVAAAMTRLTRSGGGYPSWRDEETLVYSGPKQVYTWSASSGTVDTVDVQVELPRDIGRGSVRFQGARVLTMGPEGVIGTGDIVVSDGRITCVGDCSGSPTDEEVDASGKTIMPGLFDVHAHYYLFGAGPILPERYATAANFLAYGVTTTHDPSTQIDPSFPLHELIETGRIVGPRAYSTGPALTCRPAGPLRPIETYQDAWDIVDQLADRGALSIKGYKQCTRWQRQMLTQATLERGVTLTSENTDLWNLLGMVMDGRTGWEHPLHYTPLYSDVSRFLGAAGVHYSPQLILSDYPEGNSIEHWFGQSDLWADDKVLDWTPWQAVAARRLWVTKPVEDYRFPLIAEGAADIQRAGGRVAIGAHGEQPGLGTHWEIWALAAAMTPMEVLKAATVNSAHFLGLDSELGTLEVGKVADLVILDSNPLDDIRNTVDIRQVMKAGRLYDGATLDEVWPRVRPYGPRSWTTPEIRRRDVRSDGYWDRRGGN